MCHLLDLDGPGGGPFAVAGIVRALAPAYKQTVIVGSRGKLSCSVEALGVPLIRLPIDRRWKWPLGFPMLLLRLALLRPSVIILHGQWAGFLGGLCALLLHTRKVIYVAHWPSFYADRSLWTVIRNTLAERIACRAADSLVCMCEANRNQYLMRGWVARRNCHVIPYAFDRTLMSSSEEVLAFRAQVGMKQEHLNVACVGRLHEQKRVDWLLNAWPAVFRERPDARLWLFGDGPEGDSLSARTRDLGIADSVVFAGSVPHGERAVGACDVVVMTSMWESFGLVVLEALAHRKPLVASFVDGVIQDIPSSPLIHKVAPGSAQALASGILQAAEMGDSPTCDPVVEAFAANQLSRFLPSCLEAEYVELLAAK
ncbi:MAG: glycosyltransferase family 4 protein [Terrimicrobiaceae bacterium]